MSIQDPQTTHQDAPRQSIDLAELTARSIQSLTAGWIDSDRRIYRAIFLTLAKGKPVSPEALAHLAKQPLDVVEAALARMDGALQRDDQGAIIGWSGLTLNETQHRFTVNNVALHVWCALDAHFIPALLGETAHVESRDPVYGAPVRLTVQPDGTFAPESAVASLVITRDELLSMDLIGNFCDYVHHFESPATAAAFKPEGAEIRVVSMDTLAEAAKQLNRLVWHHPESE